MPCQQARDVRAVCGFIFGLRILAIVRTICVAFAPDTVAALHTGGVAHAVACCCPAMRCCRCVPGGSA